MQGMAWAAADKRADEIVTHARHRIGLSQFPSWIEARGPTPEHKEFAFCANCGGFMPEGNDRPWCSYECHRLLDGRQRREVMRAEEVAREKARRILLTGGAEAPLAYSRGPRRCRGCGETFTPTAGVRAQRWCSRLCAARTARLKPVACLICATQFSPKREAQTFCSTPCRQEAGRRRKQQEYATMVARHHAKVCKVCSTPFTSTRSFALYCGPACLAEGARRRARAHAARRRLMAA